MTSVAAPTQAQGGDNITVSWTVQNTGTGVAQPTGWIDTVYLTNDPTNPLDKNAITMTLGSVEHDTVLNPGGTYNASLNVELSPSAVGQYFVVYTDAPQPNLNPPITPPINVVKEVSETNNLTSVATDVTPVPADLVVTNVSIPQVNYSGEQMTFTYTVTNEGPNQVWAGTAYWTDFIWLSTDTTFDPHPRLVPRPDDPRPGPAAAAGRELQHHLHGDPAARAPAASITSTSTSTPTTTCRPYPYIYQARLETTDWWPANTGDNSYWLGQFNHWAFEDPNNNRNATPFAIIYREPDLKVTNITVPAGVTSGSTIPITYTVTNQGTRATRTE